MMDMDMDEDMEKMLQEYDEQAVSTKSKKGGYAFQTYLDDEANDDEYEFEMEEEEGMTMEE